MSTPSTPAVPAAPATSTAGKILNAIASIGGDISIGVQLGEVVIPLVKGAITAIKTAITGGATISYTVELTAEQTALDEVVTIAENDLALINAELTRMGLPTIAIPAPSATAPGANPAPVPAPGTVAPVGPEPASGS